MRKPVFCICDNKGADQLRGNSAPDQRFCFRSLDSTTTLLMSSLTFFYGSAARFVSDQVGNPEYRFCLVEAHIIPYYA